MTESATERLRAATEQLMAQLQAFDDAPAPPMPVLALEDLDCTLGTMSWADTTGLPTYVGGTGCDLSWTLTTPTGAKATGTYHLGLDDHGIHVSHPSQPMGLSKLDWDAHLDDMRPVIATAMRTMPGWRALRSAVVTVKVRSRRGRVLTMLPSVVCDLDDLDIAEQWLAVSAEPDRSVANVAEGILAAGTFAGSADELLAAARAATHD